MKLPAIAINGGSGTIFFDAKDSELKNQYLEALNNALDVGFKMLADGCSATESVCKAVTILEDYNLFNAGKGSVFTVKGQHKMNSAIMDGKTLKAGAVAGLRGTQKCSSDPESVHPVGYTVLNTDDDRVYAMLKICSAHRNSSS